MAIFSRNRTSRPWQRHSRKRSPKYESISVTIMDCRDQASLIVGQVTSIYLPNHLAAADGQRPAEAVVDLRIGGVTKPMEDRGSQVLRLHPSVLGLAAHLVRSAQDLSAAHAAAGQRC